MYLHLGSQMAVRERAVVGIFDLDNTSSSKITRAFLEQAQAEGALIDVSDELPKAFVLTEEYGMKRVYLTQLGAATLQRRLEAARSGNL
ncbi:MAG: DUF370 domain-containing protein [Clostridiales bacterium]|nr:DUF370 domain-containing protein [Clostridiales bacterium]